MIESQTQTSISEQVGQYLSDHRGSAVEVPKSVYLYRAGLCEYVYSSLLGEHLNCHLFESVHTLLEQSECELTDAQKALFIEYLDEQVFEFEGSTAGFIEAYGYEFESNIVAFVKELTATPELQH